jgi:excisionase family DNA binding protein
VPGTSVSLSEATISERSVLERLEHSGRSALTVDDIRKLFKVAQSTVYGWANSGAIPCIRIGRTLRFDGAAVARHLRRSQ